MAGLASRQADEGGSPALSGLEPLAAEAPTLLVLGSFPSVASLAQGRYYAHPRNYFWPILALVFSRAEGTIGAFSEEAYRGAVELVREKKLAIWDVYASCSRSGSLDGSIRNARTNDVARFIEERPTIARVCLNGAAAAKAFMRLVASSTDRLGPLARASGEAQARSFFFDASARRVQAFLLPSTSPVPSRRYRCLEDRLPEWRAALMGKPE